MTIKKIIITLCLFCTSFATFAGGGWPQPKNKGFFKLGQYILISDQFYTPAGDIVDITTTALYTTSFYGEYGITNRLTGILYFPFFSRSTLNELQAPNGDLVEEGDELNSVGDTDITLKYGLIVNKPIVVSVSLTLGLPLGEPAGGRTQLLQTGDGEFNQMATIEASKSFSSINAYGTLLLAFNNRTNNFSDEFRYGAEVGISFGKFTALTRLYAVESLNNGDDSIVPSNGVFSNNMEFVSLAPELIYNFSDNIGFSANAAFALSGARILASTAYSFGLFLKM